MIIPHTHDTSAHGAIPMNTMLKKILPLLVLGALGSNFFAAEKPAAIKVAPVSSVAPANDLVATYTAIAAAKVKAEVALSTLAQLVDSRTNGMNGVRTQIDGARQKAMSIYDTQRNNEEAKGELKNISFITSCLAARTKLDSATTQTNQERSTLDQKMGMAAEQFGALRNAYNSAENLERSLKEARLELAAVERVYSDIEYKSKSIETVIKDSLSAYSVIDKTWSTLNKEAESFTN